MIQIFTDCLRGNGIFSLHVGIKRARVVGNAFALSSELFAQSGRALFQRRKPEVCADAFERMYGAKRILSVCPGKAIWR